MAKKAVTVVADEVVTVHGINADKLDRKAIDRAITHYKLDGKGQDVAGKVLLLQQHVRELAAADLVHCDACQQTSDSKLAECPFCGDEDEGTPTGQVAAEPEEADAAPEEVDAEEEETGEDEDPGEDMPHDEVKEAPARIESPVIDATALDAQVAEIRKLQQGTAAGAYLMAQRLTVIAKDDLWKQRRLEDGTVAYKNFDAFTKTELGFTRRYAQELLKLAVLFTEAQFLEHGPTKLRLVLTEGAKGREEEVLERLKAGQGRSRIEKEVLGRGKNKKPDQRKKENKQAAAERANYITVAAIEGKHTVKLYRGPASAGQDLVPAKRLADAPWGWFEMANDTRMYFHIAANPSGELKVMVDVRRVDPDSGQSKKGKK